MATSCSSAANYLPRIYCFVATDIKLISTIFLVALLIILSIHITIAPQPTFNYVYPVSCLNLLVLRDSRQSSFGSVAFTKAELADINNHICISKLSYSQLKIYFIYLFVQFVCWCTALHGALSYVLFVFCARFNNKLMNRRHMQTRKCGFAFCTSNRSPKRCFFISALQARVFEPVRTTVTI